MFRVLILGTPGVGKTTLAWELFKTLKKNKIKKIKHCEMSKIIQTKKLFSKFDDNLQSTIFNEI